ncbi:MAG: ATP-binding cassette domain-containing protein [Chthonomonadales bacterium]
MICVEHLTKRYGAVTAVDDVTFQAQKGEILGFLGPNGAGKTTTMRILAGCLAATEGSASIAGYDTFEASLEARRNLGYLPEQIPLYSEMTVWEYLTFAAELRSVRGQELRRRMDHVLPRCGLTDVRYKTIGRLSRGYRQRLGLAQALIHNPPVLILDEPTVGLDPRQIVEVRSLIKSLAPDHTVLLSTHILPEVSMVCSRVVIIDRGKVVAEDTPQNLTSFNRGTAFVVEVEGPARQVTSVLQNAPGVARVDLLETRGSISRHRIQCHADDGGGSADARKGVAEAVVRSGFGLLELQPERVTLEDVFVRLTTTEAAA